MRFPLIALASVVVAFCFADDCPTFLSGGTALIDAATVAELAGGTWEHTNSEIIIKAKPEVRCPFSKREYRTDQATYPTSGASLYFSWLNVGLVPVRLLELYSWSIAWDGEKSTITVRRGEEERQFRMLHSSDFFARYGAQPRPNLSLGSSISYVYGYRAARQTAGSRATAATSIPLFRPPTSRWLSPSVAENRSYYGEISKATGRPKTVHVSGYYRKDGTYVRGHYRSPPRR